MNPSTFVFTSLNYFARFRSNERLSQLYYKAKYADTPTYIHNIFMVSTFPSSIYTAIVQLKYSVKLLFYIYLYHSQESVLCPTVNNKKTQDQGKLESAWQFQMAILSFPQMEIILSSMKKLYTEISSQGVGGGEGNEVIGVLDQDSAL